MSADRSNKSSFATLAEGISPSDLKTIFDRAKVKCVLGNSKEIPMEALLNGVYEIKVMNKSERAYVHLLNEYGMSQLAINKSTGIGLRRIKSYLATNEMEETK